MPELIVTGPVVIILFPDDNEKFTDIVLLLTKNGAVTLPVNTGLADRATVVPVPVTEYSPRVPALSYRTRPDVPLVMVVVPMVMELGPAEPVAPVGPAGPVEPVTPVAPVGPVGPVAPVGPAAPVAPTAPATPMFQDA